MKKLSILVMLCFSIGIISCSSEKKEVALQWKKSKVAQEFIVNASASSKYILLEDGANFLIGIESNSNNFQKAKSVQLMSFLPKKMTLLNMQLMNKDATFFAL